VSRWHWMILRPRLDRGTGLPRRCAMIPLEVSSGAEGRWATRAMALIIPIMGTFVASLSGQVITYEGSVIPETEGWERRLAGTLGAERTVVDGWFVQTVGLPEGWPGPTGDADFYRMPLDAFVGAAQFFVEWRGETDNPAWLLDLSAVPVVAVAGGNGPGFYHTTMTNERVQLLRSVTFPLVFVDLAADVPHTYRLELDADRSYAWFIDGIAVESGQPEGPYPDATERITWGVRRSYVDATTRWDYVRYGVIPIDGSGDYDSDEDVDGRDFYFFHECLTNDRPGINGGPDNDAGPGCRFADFDADTDVDLQDVAVFQQLFTGNE